MVRILALLTVLAVVAPAADTTLLNLAPPDAKVVAGIDVAAVRTSAFGQFALSKLSEKESSDFKQFVDSTGFDPRRDLTEILYATGDTNGQPKKQLFVARGAFDRTRLAAAATKAGAAISSYNGLDLLTFTQKGSGDSAVNALAFLDGSLAVAGDSASVQAAIDRSRSGGGLTGDLAAKAMSMSGTNQIWFASMASLSDMAANLSHGQQAGGPQEILKSIRQANGGLKFDDPITLSIELVAQTAQDASSLSGALQMLLGMAQMQQQKSGMPPQVQQLLKTLTLNASGTSVNIGLSMPEAALESLIPPSAPAAAKRP